MSERPYICVNFGGCQRAGERTFRGGVLPPTCAECGQAMVGHAQGGARWRLVVLVVAIIVAGVGTSALAVRWRQGRSGLTAGLPAGHSVDETVITTTPAAVPIARYFDKPDVQDLLAKASKGDLGGVRFILARRPQIASEKGHSGISPLHAALFVHDAVAFETLLAAGFDRHVPADNGISPLMASAMLPNPRFLAAALADATAALKQSDVKGRNALHLAVINRQAANVRLLLGKGADPNCKDMRGSTPLMAAFQGRQPVAEIVRTLLEAGADPGMVDRTGLKARDFAASFHDPAILAMMP